MTIKLPQFDVVNHAGIPLYKSDQAVETSSATALGVRITECIRRVSGPRQLLQFEFQIVITEIAMRF